MLFNESHLIHFPEGRDSRLHFGQGALPQRDHPFFNGRSLDLGSRPAIHNHFTDAVGEVEQFADGRAAMKAGSGAFQTAGTFGEIVGRAGRRIDPGVTKLRFAMFFRTLAVGADDTHKTLGQDAVQRGDEVVRFDPHVDETPYHIGYVVGVNRRKDQVAGQRRLNGDLRRFLVADFADHDFVGVVAQNGTQPAGKRQALLFVDGNLGNTSELVFDGVFNRHNFVFVRLNLVNGRIQCGGLAGAGRSRNEHHPVRLADVAAKTLRLGIGIADDVQRQLLELLREGLLVQNAEYRVLTVACGHDRDAQVDVAPLVLHAKASVLGNTALGNVQIAEYLDAGDDGGMPFLGDGLHGVLQDPVNAVLDRNLGIAGLDMNVAGAPLERREDDRFDQAHNRANRGIARQTVARDCLFGFFLFL